MVEGNLPDSENSDQVSENNTEHEETKNIEVDAPIKIGPFCATPDCGKPAPLACPKCKELEILNSSFCSQACFKSYYPIHKKLHKPAGNTNGISKPIISGGGDLIVHYPGFQPTGSLMPYKQTPKRPVPAHIEKPDYADDPRGYPMSEIKSKRSGLISVLTDEEIAGVKKASELGREVLEVAAAAIKVGITTDEIDRIVHEACIVRDCYPSPLNYYNFPKSCCTSVNEVVCHGIPDLRPLQDGDILNIDISVYHKGFHGDLNETYFIGRPDEDSVRLVATAFNCLHLAIQSVKPGMKYRDVGAIIQKEAQANKCSVVRTYCGHGIHRFFHCAPTVPHYGKNKAIGIMKPGHCFTIEPMINLGKFQDETWPDDWTSVTCDGHRSAQFEQTLLCTETGVEIISGRKSHLPPAHFLQQLREFDIPFPSFLGEDLQEKCSLKSKND